MKISSLTAFALCAALVACGDKDSTGSASSSGLSGTFVSGCIVTDSASYKVVEVFTATTVSGTANYYSDKSCTSGQEILLARRTGNVTVGGAATTPAGATKLDLSNMRFYLTPKSDQTVTSLNGNSRYGKTDWVKNREKEVTGLADRGTTEPTTQYDIFMFTGDTLCSGDDDDTYDGTSDAKRPQVLETGTKCYTKQ